jgi:hypothetical protein
MEAGVSDYAWMQEEFVWLLDWAATQTERPDSN